MEWWCWVLNCFQCSSHCQPGLHTVKNISSVCMSFVILTRHYTCVENTSESFASVRTSFSFRLLLREYVLPLLVSSKPPFVLTALTLTMVSCQLALEMKYFQVQSWLASPSCTMINCFSLHGGIGPIKVQNVRIAALQNYLALLESSVYIMARPNMFQIYVRHIPGKLRKIEIYHTLWYYRWHCVVIFPSASVIMTSTLMWIFSVQMVLQESQYGSRFADHTSWYPVLCSHFPLKRSRTQCIRSCFKWYNAFSFSIDNCDWFPGKIYANHCLERQRNLKSEERVALQQYRILGKITTR